MGKTRSNRWSRVTAIADRVRKVVLDCAVTFRGKKYPSVTGYQAIANAFDCVASACDVVRVEGGWQARGLVRRMSDGLVLSEGVGFVGDDEPAWQAKPQFSKMAMAQTRACGRALRAAFAFVAPLIDENLQAAPAEEMSLVEGTIAPPPPRGAAALRERLRPAPHADTLNLAAVSAT